MASTRAPHPAPQIQSLRLSHRTAHRWRPSSEQEVLHYQWFADFGNVDAARAVAHMLSHGAQRDHDQALRYLRQVGGGQACAFWPWPGGLHRAGPAS